MGRDVLARCAAGIVLACLLGLYVLVPRWFGYPDPPTPTFFLDSLHGMRSAMAQLSSLLLRLGFLPLVVTQVALWLFKKYPMTFDTSAWYFGVGFTGMLVLAALALYGFRTSLGGQPAFSAARLED